MKTLRIAFFAALPWEYKPFKGNLRPWKILSRKPYSVFQTSLNHQKEIFLIETGMGREVIDGALNWAAWSVKPDLLVSFGFSGGLHSSMQVGRTFLCTDFILCDKTFRITEEEAYRFEPHPEIISFCLANGIGTARAVTTLRFEAKARLSPHLGSVLTLVDMESYFVAQFAKESGLPFLCFRSISDTLEQELEYTLEDIADSRGRIELRRVLESVRRDPSLLAAFYASWKRSNKAGKALGRILTAFVRLPVSQLGSLGSPAAD